MEFLQRARTKDQTLTNWMEPPKEVTVNSNTTLTWLWVMTIKHEGHDD